MDHTFVDVKNLKTLEHYAILLTSGLITLTTLQNIQVRAIEAGLLPEDLQERANTIIWDSRRQMKQYQMQLEEVVALLPDDFNAMTALESLRLSELAKARLMKKKRVKN